jgi:hypothetical protein
MYDTLNETVFLGLSPENQKKVEEIYSIASTAKNCNLPAITPKFFDNLYDLSISELSALRCNMSYRYGNHE